jgi:hypothetical protein
MFLNTDYIDPAELTGYARAALADIDQNQFTLSRWLPNQLVDDLEYRFTRGGAEGLLEAATFRAYDTEARMARRPGISRVTGELPPISRKIRLGEYDRLRQRKLEAKVGDQIFSDAERVVRAIAARLELARGQALVTGAVTLNEDGVVASVDFGRNAGHTVTLAGGDLWSATATATPIEDLLGWVETYKANNFGVAPGAILISTQVLSLLVRNAEVRAFITNGQPGPAIVTRDALQAVLTAHGLPTIYTYDAQLKPDNGVATRVIAADKVLLLPAPGDSSAGATLYGTPAESFEPDFGLAGEEAGIVSGVYKSVDPVALWTLASAIALPILGQPDLTFVADVL